jgi:hypothetical protein
MRPHPPHIVDEHRQLVGLVHVETHRGGVEFLGMVRFSQAV